MAPSRHYKPRGSSLDPVGYSSDKVLVVTTQLQLEAKTCASVAGGGGTERSQLHLLSLRLFCGVFSPSADWVKLADVFEPQRMSLTISALNVTCLACY